MQTTAVDQLINHVTLVLDRSTSMQKHEKTVLEVAKSEIANLAKKSEDFNQDTRISIYSFGNDVQCLVYDKDVLRLPDISRHYKISGSTALIDATLKSIEDLEKIPQLYGDHAFLNIVVTDGEENQSVNSASSLSSKLSRLSENWTMATLVPNEAGIREAVRYGFSKENCGVWNTTHADGFKQVGQTVRNATDTFYTNRAAGVRGTRSIFNINVSNITKEKVDNTLYKMRPELYTCQYVGIDSRADDFMTRVCKRFELGRVFYQLTKPETIQAQKQVLVKDIVTGDVYSGARQILGLPNTDVKVDPVDHNRYHIFVQSTAPNRKLIGGTECLIMR